MRTARGTSLTEAGTALLARADAVHSALHQAEEELGALADLRAGTVRLAAFLGRRDAGATARCGHCTPTTRASRSPSSRPSPRRPAAVLAGEVDVALVFAYDGPPVDDGSLAWVPLHVEPMHLVLPAADRVPARIGTDWLAEQGWVAGCERCRQHLLARCRTAGFEPRLLHESDDYVVVQNLVAHGLGVTVLPDLALRAFRHPEVVVRRSRAFGERARRDGAPARRRGGAGDPRPDGAAAGRGARLALRARAPGAASARSSSASVQPPKPTTSPRGPRRGSSP